MAERKRKGPQKGSPRVAAWIHEVINPLRETLPLEISFLQSGNTTWRYYSGRPEYPRPIEDYLTPQGRFILIDFCRANRDAKKRLTRHDRLLEYLIGAAIAAHASLMNREDFVRRARERLGEFRQIASGGDYPGGAILEVDFPKLVAERVVNSIKEVPPHYSDATFWERYGAEFLDFGSGPEFERLRTARNALLKHDQALYEWLGKTSFRLCEEYDVPAAPFAGWGAATRTAGSA